LKAVNYNKEHVKEVYEETYATKTKSRSAIKDEYVSTVIRFNNLLKKLKISIPTNGRYLDIACGDGIKTNALSQYFNNTLGVDFSKNAIACAKKTFGSEVLQFKELDLETEKLDEQFDVVTSFGNSILNVSDEEKISNHVLADYNNFVAKQGTLILGSFTDFSGNAPTGWYNLTNKQLNKITHTINQYEGVICEVYFPHQDINNYLSNALSYTLKELHKLLFQKRRYYYIVIKTKQ
jgi:SAM-dependent methyltransferase